MHREAAAAATAAAAAAMALPYMALPYMALPYMALPYMALPYMVLMEVDSEKKMRSKKKVFVFHQSGLEKRTLFDFERSRTAATRSTTYKGSKKIKMLFLKKTMSKTSTRTSEKFPKTGDLRKS